MPAFSPPKSFQTPAPQESSLLSSIVADDSRLATVNDESTQQVLVSSCPMIPQDLSSRPRPFILSQRRVRRRLEFADDPFGDRTSTSSSAFRPIAPPEDEMGPCSEEATRSTITSATTTSLQDDDADVTPTATSPVVSMPMTVREPRIVWAMADYAPLLPEHSASTTKSPIMMRRAVFPGRFY